MAEFEGSSKPADVIEKIASGKMEKFFSEICLMNQSYIKDEDKTIGDILKEVIGKTGENMKISRISRFALADSVDTGENEEAPAC